jgi:hypothetical protein
MVAGFVVAAVGVVGMVEQLGEPAVDQMLVFRGEGHVLVEGCIYPARLVAAHRP